VLAFHLSTQHLVAPSIVPVLYALAMGAASIAAVGFGRIYDRVGLRGLIVLPPLAIAVPFLSFSSTTALFVLGAILWGAGVGVHDSTMRAAVADFVPAHRRGAVYGTFTAIYGLAWLAGATVIGLLYEHGLTSVVVFVTAVQAVACCCSSPCCAGDPRRRTVTAAEAPERLKYLTLDRLCASRHSLTRTVAGPTSARGRHVSRSSQFRDASLWCGGGSPGSSASGHRDGRTDRCCAARVRPPAARPRDGRSGSLPGGPAQQPSASGRFRVVVTCECTACVHGSLP
jgi:hypothetical protein